MKAYPDVRLSGDQRKRNSLRWLVLLLAPFLAALPVVASAAGTKAEAKQGRLVMLPFAVQIKPPQDHLRSGLANVLATRIADRTGLIPLHGVDKTGELEELLRKGEQKEAGKLLKSMQGDYLLAGSLEQQGGSYEITIHVFSGKKSAALAAFSRTFATMDKTIPILDELSAEIAEKAFNQKPPEEQADAAADKKGGSSGFQTAHPDRLYQESLHGDAEESSMASDAFSILTDRSSNSMSASFHAMDAGDLDADGQEELALLESGRLRLYRFGEDQFRQIAESRLPGHLGLHAVHLADLDGRRGLEIYVSASNGSSPSSLVLQWDGGSKFHVLDERVPYYFRPDLDSSGNPVLLGQAGGMICRMTVAKDGRTARAEEVQVPDGFGLYDFVRADLDQDGRREFVGITEENKLLVMDQNGKTLWKSEEIYGASRNSLGTMASNRQADLDRPYDRSRTYLHARIIVQDQNGDGRPEVIVGRNRVANVKFFKHIRYFEGSSIVALSWDGARMNRLWETKEIPGYTVDYQVATEAAEPDRFRLFSVESDDSGNPLYFWSPENSVIRVREMAASGNPKDAAAGRGRQ